MIKCSLEKYKNPWINVREDQVIRPDGKDGIYGVVDMLDGVSILPLDNNGYVYLTKTFQYAVQRESIEVVSGGIDDAEDALAAAKRELKEETGIEAENWIDLGAVDPFTSVVKSSAQLYIAQKLSFSNTDLDGTEEIDIIKLKLEEVVQMVMEGAITHGASAVVILKAARYLNV